jgi:adenylate cyclase
MLQPFIVVVKRHALRAGLSLAILLFFVLHALKIIEWNFIDALEHKLYDARLELTLPNTTDSRIVIVDIDEHSLSVIGRWPWNRAVMAKLIDQLFDTYQIDVLGMGAMFVEPDNSSGLKKLEELAQGPLKEASAFLDILTGLRNTLDYDKVFANSLENRRIVLGYALTTAQEATAGIETGQLPQPAFTQSEVQAHRLKYIEGRGFAANLPLFQASALTAGHFNMEPDSDGIVRRIPMLYGYKGQLYESLALAVTRIALGESQIKFDFNIEGKQRHLKNLIIGDREVPVDEYLQTLVPYRGTWPRFPYVSAAEVWQGKINNPALFRNKIVLLGTTAQGLLDLRATPMENIYPGVEIHANLISGILDNNIRSTSIHQNTLEFWLLLLIGLVMITLLPLFSPLMATLGTLGLSGLLIWINLIIWVDYHLVLPLAMTLLLILSLFIFNMSYGYFIESSNKRHLTNLFGQYIPPELVDEMSKNLGNTFSMEGESRKMTVLFSDVRGFTTISEGLDSKELSELMNEYLTPMTQIIHEHRGTIDKYMGDAIMAFWGAPLHDPQHARHALDAAMEMIQHLTNMQPLFKAKGWPEIRIGIGLNTGVMSVGNMGSQFRVAYTVLGDAVNLGSRLEELTKKYGVQIIVSETTQAAVPEYLYRELDRVKVKGKDQPVAIFEPIGLRNKIDIQTVVEIGCYEQALESYRQQQWVDAQTQFAELQQQSPAQALYRLYAQRVEYFIENPPDENWDGVYTFTTK